MRPVGSSWTRSHAGVAPFFGVRESHADPSMEPALQESGPPPSPAFASATLSRRSAMLPTAAVWLSFPGATARVATGGWLLVSLSTLQVVTMSSSRVHAATPIAR